MNIGLPEHEHEDIHICWECDEEFIVTNRENPDQQVEYCPYCGASFDAEEYDPDEEDY